MNSKESDLLEEMQELVETISDHVDRMIKMNRIQELEVDNVLMRVRKLMEKSAVLKYVHHESIQEQRRAQEANSRAEAPLDLPPIQEMPPVHDVAPAADVEPDFGNWPTSVSEHTPAQDPMPVEPVAAPLVAPKPEPVSDVTTTSAPEPPAEQPSAPLEEIAAEPAAELPQEMPVIEQHPTAHEAEEAHISPDLAPGILDQHETPSEPPQEQPTEKLDVEALKAEMKAFGVGSESGQSVNEAASGQTPGDLASKLQQQPIADLKSAISLNQKFQFIQELFGGSAEAYNMALEELNNLNNFQEAQGVMLQREIGRENPELFATFSEVVARRYL